MKVVLAADHGGFNLKEELKKYLLEEWHDVEDGGAHVLDPADDYPDFIYPAAQKVGADRNSRGIFVCRSGAGAAIVANKVQGVRAVVAHDVSEIIHARKDNNANVLALSGDVVGEGDARNMVVAFLRTPFSDEERHARRLKKIEHIETEHSQ